MTVKLDLGERKDRVYWISKGLLDINENSLYSFPHSIMLQHILVLSSSLCIKQNLNASL